MNDTVWMDLRVGGCHIVRQSVKSVLINRSKVLDRRTHRMWEILINRIVMVSVSFAK